jgi:WD40 repeat protein
MRKLSLPTMVILLILCLFVAFLSVTAQESEEDADGIGIPPENVLPDDPHEPEIVWSVGWSPDGSKIAYGVGASRCNLSNNDYFVRIVDVDTSIEVIHINVRNKCPITDVVRS